VRIVSVRGATAQRRTDLLAGEEPMAIRAAGPGQEPLDIAVTMRTPGNDEDLAAGFLITEGLVSPGAIAGFTLGDPSSVSHPDNTITVRLTEPLDPSRVAGRNFVATASCGLCGKASIDDVERRVPPVAAGPTVSREVLVALPDRLRAVQTIFSRTGGLHACAAFDADGTLGPTAEDVGRHNALDKLVGIAAQRGMLPLAGRGVLVSGRVSFEIVQKTAMAGAGLLAAVSAPTDLAVRVADRLGLTLVGFLRDDSFNVYAHPERIADL